MAAKFTVKVVTPNLATGSAKLKRDNIYIYIKLLRGTVGTLKDGQELRHSCERIGTANKAGNSRSVKWFLVIQFLEIEARVCVCVWIAMTLNQSGCGWLACRFWSLLLVRGK